MASQPTNRLRRIFSAAARGLSGSRSSLTYCPECRRPFMCPMEWETAGESHWLIELRCGECGCWREVRTTNEEASAFDLLLDRQTAPIERELERLDRRRMEAEAEAFIAALEHDLVDAADFAS